MDTTSEEYSIIRGLFTNDIWLYGNGGRTLLIQDPLNGYPSVDPSYRCARMIGTYNYVIETRRWDTQARKHTYVLPDMKIINSLHTHAIIIYVIIILRIILLTRKSTLHSRITQQFYKISLPISRHGYNNKNHRPNIDKSSVNYTPPPHHLQAHSQRPHMHPRTYHGLCQYPFHCWKGIRKISHLHPLPIMADLLTNFLSNLSSKPRWLYLLRAQLQLIRSCQRRKCILPLIESL